VDKILVTEKIGDEGLATMRRQAEVDERVGVDTPTLLEILPQYDALVVRSGTKVTAEVIDAGERLRVIGRAGTGVDNIDVGAATRRGIVVVNAPASNSVAVAELTVGLILGLARQIPQAHMSLGGGKWERSKFMGLEVRGRTLGLLGLGRIGGEVARRARGLEMQVIAHDPVVSTDRAAHLGVELVGFEELLARSDFLSLHVPLIDSTRNLFDGERLAKMRRGTFLINASRGGIVDEAALVAAIDGGQLAGAALDVFSSEPPGDTPAVGHPRIIATPHLGASTEEAQALTAADVAEGVLAVLGGGTPLYAVNAPFVPPEEWALVGPYIDLARRLGALCAQLVDEPVRSYELALRGELAQSQSEPLRLAALQGLLSVYSEQRVTPVNAPLLARERGLRLNERSDADAEDYTSLLQLTALTAEGERTFIGTVVRDEGQVVNADGYWVNFNPSGPMLITYHHDRPGMIGRIGTILGNADVNISAMHVGRLAPRGQAMMVLMLDEPAGEAALAQVRAETGIARVFSVTL
jgi:D-3-phosphoglycerate dehydrogenase / 2-oxoglutarate reductase